MFTAIEFVLYVEEIVEIHTRMIDDKSNDCRRYG